MAYAVAIVDTHNVSPSLPFLISRIKAPKILGLFMENIVTRCNVEVKMLK